MPHLPLLCWPAVTQVVPSQQPLQLLGAQVGGAWQVPVPVLQKPIVPVQGPQASPPWPQTRLLCESSVTQSPFGAQQPPLQVLALQVGLPPPVPVPPPVVVPPPLPPVAMPPPVFPPPLAMPPPEASPPPVPMPPPVPWALHT